MSVCYTIEWSSEAIYDVAEIAEYIEEAFGEARADRFIEDLKEAVGRLSYLRASHEATGFCYRGEKILKLVFKPSIVFYCVDELNVRISILRVLRHERNWQGILDSQTPYTFD